MTDKIEKTLAAEFGGHRHDECKPVRPWGRHGTRLGIKLGGKLGDPTKLSGTSSIGWILYHFGPSPIIQGEHQMPEPTQIGQVQLTPAERKTLREDCGLSVADAADWLGVEKRTLEGWEAGKADPKHGAYLDLATLRARLGVVAGESLLLAQAQIAAHPEISGQPVELIRYTVQDYPHTQPAREGLPHGAHNRLIAMTADALAGAGIKTVIEYRGAGSWAPTTTPEAGGWETDAPDFAKPK